MPNAKKGRWEFSFPNPADVLDPDKRIKRQIDAIFLEMSHPFSRTSVEWRSGLLLTLGLMQRAFSLWPRGRSPSVLDELDVVRAAEAEEAQLRARLATGGAAEAVRLGLWPPDRQLRISGGR